MKEIFTVMGKPVAWERAGRVGNFYFDKQRNEKMLFAHVVKTAMKGSSFHSKPVKVVVEYNMPLAPSLSKKQRDMRLLKPHPFTPDLDNLLKFLFDALNKVLWKDDRLIYEVHARKTWGSEPKLILGVEEYDNSDFSNLFK
ncbi:RusA family crossover junction endodeoxyribonuclease [Candidatus Woesearchaeota archaeon]|nr:RusA family crossover junction endodeoxyribonuclease [Candidatus Woesearchaeota archaeon]